MHKIYVGKGNNNKYSHVLFTFISMTAYDVNGIYVDCCEFNQLIKEISVRQHKLNKYGKSNQVNDD